MISDFTGARAALVKRGLQSSGLQIFPRPRGAKERLPLKSPRPADGSQPPRPMKASAPTGEEEAKSREVEGPEKGFVLVHVESYGSHGRA